MQRYRPFFAKLVCFLVASLFLFLLLLLPAVTVAGPLHCFWTLDTPGWPGPGKRSV